MKKVRTRFTGTPGTLGLFGDSITVSLAFWAPLEGTPKNMSESMAAAHKVVKQHMQSDCWRKWRGPKNGTVVILTTAPPRSGHLEKSKKFAESIRRVSKEKKVPLIDYHAEVLKRRADDWDGALPQFKDVKGSEYEVPTLIARDGVHP